MPEASDESLSADADVPSELPELEAVTNFRELGGLMTRDGRRVRKRRLFRSGHWGFATDSDVAVMRSLGIVTVFDFRSEKDIEHEGLDRLPEGTEHIHLPTFDPAATADIRTLVLQSTIEELRELFGEGRGADMMRASARDLVDERSEQYTSFLGRLAEADAPTALFHCSAGKDRAGWAGSVVLLALGVPEETVVAHYLLSNIHYRPQDHKGLGRKLDPAIGELMLPLSKVHEDYVQASLDAANQRFGSIDAYLRDGLSLSDAMREQLRETWLE